MGKYGYPQVDRKVKEGEEYVAFRRMRMSNKTIEPGDRIKVTEFTRLRLRQLLEWSWIVPRWHFNEVQGITETPKKPVKKKTRKKGVKETA